MWDREEREKGGISAPVPLTRPEIATIFHLMIASPSPLDQQRALIEQLRAEIERQELILLGMERMAAFAPTPKSSVSRRFRAAELSSTSRGRQPGAISQRWRDVLAALYSRGNRFDDDAVVATVKQLEERDIRRSEVRRLFQNHRTNGLVAFNIDGTYSVTDHAVAKFDLGRNEEGPTDRSGGPSMGGVAERLNAPDYESGEVQGSGPPSMAPQTSVGSNPTASAPLSQPWESSSDPATFTMPPYLPSKG